MLKTLTALISLLVLPFFCLVLEAQENESCYSLELESVATAPGEPFCIDMTAKGFDQLLGFQWSIRYDPTILAFTEVTNFSLPGLSQGNFGAISENLNWNVFATSWTNPSAHSVDVSENQLIASLCFQPLVASGKTVVEFFNEPTSVEIITDLEAVESTGLIAAEVIIGDEPENELKIEEICIQAGNCQILGAAIVEVFMDGRESSFTYTWTGLTEYTTDDPVFEVPTPGLYQLEVTDATGAKAIGSVHISESIRESLVQSYVEAIPCDQENGGRISLTTNDVNANYEFLWSNGENTQVVDNLSAGVYTVTITETETNCQSLELFLVEQRRITGDTDVTCIGEDEVNIRAYIYDIVPGDSLNFAWSTGEVSISLAQDDIRIPLQGNDSYAVTVSTQDGCFVVLEGDLPDCGTEGEQTGSYDACLIYEINKVVADQGEVKCVDVKTRGFEDLASYQYTVQWNPEQLRFVEVQNFELGIVSNSFGITVDELLEEGKLTSLWVDNEGDLGHSITDGEIIYSLCFEVLAESGFAPIRIRDDPAIVEVNWVRDAPTDLQPISVSFIDGGIQIGSSLAGMPSILELCVDELGCGDTGVEKVSAVVTGGLLPYTYLWTGPDNFSSTDPEFEAPREGLYFLTVTDITGAFTTATVKVMDTDIYLAVTAEVTPVSCEASNDGAIRLTSIIDPSDYTFAWNNGETTRDILNLSVGEYTVTITDNATSCTTIERFIVNPESIIAALYYSCEDSLTADVSASVFTQGNEPYTFSWSNGVQKVAPQVSTVQVMEGDSINVTVTNDSGCTYVSQFIYPVCSAEPVNNRLVTSYAYNCAPDNQSATITAYVWGAWQGPYTYAWSTGEVEEGASTSSITVPISGTYSVTISDGFGKSEVSGGIVPNCEEGDPESLTISIGEANATTGESICLAVRVDNFTNILGLQYAVSWDPDLLELDSLQNFSLPNLDESSFDLGETNYQNGLLRFSWLDLTGVGVTLPNDAGIYEMCFTVTGNEGEASVSFDEQSIQAEFVNEEFEAESPSLKNGLIIINGEERVWPGDTDKNKITNHYDVLNLGLSYGATGPVRENADLFWRGQWANDWGQLTPSTAIDFKHIDTNGDGIINSADTTAISLNWGRAVNLVPNPMEEYRSSPYEVKTQGVPIYIEAFPAVPGERVSFNINLGDSESPVEGAYGLAFSIVYDPLAVVYGSVKASFEQSWLGELGTDMIALSKDEPNQHRLHIGLTRIDQVEIDGSGAIGQISMTIEDVIFRDTEYEMPFRVENVRLIRANEEEVQVTQKQTIGTITDTPLAVEDFSMASRIKLYPNPTKDVINIQYESIRVDRVQVLNLEGQILQEYKAMGQLSLGDLVPSTYILRFIGVDGVALKKVLKNE